MDAPCATERAAAAASPSVHPSAYVGRHVQLGRGVRVGPMATLLDASAKAPTVVADGVEIGGNATVVPGCQVGLRARIAPGAVVQRSVPPLALVEGNPGRIVGYTDSPRWAERQSNPAATCPRVVSSRVAGVTLHHLPAIADLRGTLSPGEVARDVPFAVQRYFLVYGVPTAEVRGEHAHHRCAQFLLAVHGSVRVVVDDGQQREEIVLDRPNLGLYVPPMVWGVQYCYRPDSVLLVFASEAYDAADYIRDYGAFVALTTGKRRGRSYPSTAAAATSSAVAATARCAEAH